MNTCSFLQHETYVMYIQMKNETDFEAWKGVAKVRKNTILQYLIWSHQRKDCVDLLVELLL